MVDFGDNKDGVDGDSIDDGGADTSDGIDPDFGDEKTRVGCNDDRIVNRRVEY